MALPEEPLSIVEQWKKKCFEMSQSNDTLVSLLTKSIDTMAVVLNKKSDLNRVERALVSLESERSISLQFDQIKNDEVRTLVYGHIESLHFTLSELTKESNQVNECGVMFTQTDHELSEPFLVHPLPTNQLKESAEMCTQTDQEFSQPSLVLPLQSNDSSHNDFDYHHEEPPVNWLEMPKEELLDEISIKNEDIWGDEMAIKDKEILNDYADTHNADGHIVGDRRDISSTVDNGGIAQSEMHVLSYMGVEFENEDVVDSMDNVTMGEEEEKDSSDTVEVEKKRRSSRNVSRPVKSVDCESLEFSDEDSEPTIKKSKTDSSKMKIRKSSGAIEKKVASARSTGKSREMKCTECKFQTTKVYSLLDHLRNKHSTTLALAGLALRCDCGVETVSNGHSYKCEIANFTVVRKRDGPIQTFNDEKRTPQCVICEVYPKTAHGYIAHLYLHHKSLLSAHGIWLLCKCGAKYRQKHPDSKHSKECTHREFTLHKYADN